MYETRDDYKYSMRKNAIDRIEIMIKCSTESESMWEQMYFEYRIGGAVTLANYLGLITGSEGCAIMDRARKITERRLKDEKR